LNITLYDTHSIKITSNDADRYFSWHIDYYTAKFINFWYSI